MKLNLKKISMSLCILLSIFSKSYGKSAIISSIENYTDYTASLVVASDYNDVFSEGIFQVSDVIFGKNAHFNIPVYWGQNQRIFLKIVYENQKLVFQIPINPIKKDDVTIKIYYDNQTISVAYSTLLEPYISRNMKYHYLNQSNELSTESQDSDDSGLENKRKHLESLIEELSDYGSDSDIDIIS